VPSRSFHQHFLQTFLDLPVVVNFFSISAPTHFEEIMSFVHWLAIATLASIPFAAFAQQEHSPTDPAHASATVPASTYLSAFTNYQSIKDEQASPDKTWRAANDAAGKLKGHAGHMKDDSTASAPEVAAAERGKRVK
jgi:hypothetical protein